MKDDIPEAEKLRIEMYVHLEELRTRCSALIESKHPLDVYNDIQGIRSIVGQLAAASVRWRSAR